MSKVISLHLKEKMTSVARWTKCKKKGIHGTTRQWNKFIFKGRTNTSIFDEVSSEKTSYDELHNVFNNLYDKCLKFSRLFTKQKKIISSLKSKSKDMQDEIDKYKLDIPRSCLTCNKCAFIESKIVELNKVICIYEKGKMDRIMF